MPASATERRAAPTPTAPRVWAVGGGKGGVGKSFVGVHLAAACALAGRRVVIVDADLGGANLDTLLGCPHPEHDLGDFFAKRVPTLAAACVPTDVPNLRLLAGDSDTLGAANPHHAQKLKLLRHLRKLDADLVLLDLGAGSTFNVLDLFLAADERICVTQPEPTALQNAFAFLKAATLRDIERRSGVKQRQKVGGSVRAVAARSGTTPHAGPPVRLVVNRARPAEGRNVANALADLANRFLGIHVVLAGTVADDLAVRGAVRQGRPLFLSHPASPAAADVRRIAEQLAAPRSRTPSSVAMGINETVVVDGVSLHLQTEDLGDEQAAVVSQVFRSDGAVLYSRRTPYSDRFFAKLGVAPADRARYHHVAVRRALQTGRIPLELRRSA